MRGGGGGGEEMSATETASVLKPREPALKTLEPSFLKSLFPPSSPHLYRTPSPAPNSWLLSLSLCSSWFSLCLNSMHSLALFLSFFFQQPLQRLDAFRLAFFSSSHCDWVGWVGDKPRRKEGLFESLFITCVVALNLPFPITRSTLKLINAQLGECGLYVIKPLPRSALPLNPCLERFREFEAVDRGWIDNPWFGRPPPLTEDR